MIIRSKYVNFVFRHRFEKDPVYEFTRHNKWKIGLWVNANRSAGIRNFGKPSQWKSNMIPCVLIGIDLLICSAWVDISFGDVMRFGGD